jgi:hypothetical protein
MTAPPTSAIPSVHIEFCIDVLVDTEEISFVSFDNALTASALATDITEHISEIKSSEITASNIIRWYLFIAATFFL